MTTLEQIFRHLKKWYEEDYRKAEEEGRDVSSSLYYRAHANGVNHAWRVVRDLLVEDEADEERFGVSLCEELEESSDERIY